MKAVKEFILVFAVMFSVSVVAHLYFYYLFADISKLLLDLTPRATELVPLVGRIA